MQQIPRSVYVLGTMALAIGWLWLVLSLNERARETGSAPASRAVAPAPEPRIDSLLAVVDLGHIPNQSDIAPYTRVLDVLDPRCSENRQMIGDMATRATQLVARDFGRRVSARSVLEALEEAATDISRRQCSDILATLIVMIGSG